MRFFEDDVEPGPWPPDNTSQGRYQYRLAEFLANGENWPKLRHHFYWMVHNCVAHPFLAFWPNDKSVEFHQITSSWLNHRWACSRNTQN